MEITPEIIEQWKKSEEERNQQIKDRLQKIEAEPEEEWQWDGGII